MHIQRAEIKNKTKKKNKKKTKKKIRVSEAAKLAGFELLELAENKNVDNLGRLKSTKIGHYWKFDNANKTFQIWCTVTFLRNDCCFAGLSLN